MKITAHLSAMSDFSIGESMLQVGTLIEKAKAAGYTTVGLVDTMSIHAIVDFTQKAKKAEITPIIGCRIRVVEDPTYRKPKKASGEKEQPNPIYMLKAYCKSEKGVKSLFKLLSKANSDDYFYYHARVGLADVLELEDVVITTGDFYGLFGVRDVEKSAVDIANKLHARFGDDFYAELNPGDTPLHDTVNAKVLSFALEAMAHTLVGYPSLYVEPGDAPSLQVLNAITTNTPMDSPWRPKQFTTDFGVFPPDKLIQRIIASNKRVKELNLASPAVATASAALWSNGVKNIDKVVEACAYRFEKMPVSLPKMAENEFATLGKKCIEGWHRRFSDEVLGYKPTAADIPVYQERMRYELAVLKHMGFSGYFLLAADLVMWSKANDIIVGPGRGSVGGSLVAYLIGITDVDPIRFDLMFERFINPERLDLPDADLDFMSSKRHLVVEYLREKYGADRVAGIANYSTLASASALRDTGRMHGLSNLELAVTKLVPKEHGISFSLTESADSVPELSKFRTERPEIWKHALKLEGAMRSFGQHAAGIVVAGEPISGRAVFETRHEQPIVNWDKRSVEDWGLVKLDLLGLSTLDVLEIARQYIQARHKVDVEYIRIPLEEPDIMEAFSKGETTGVFQFESPGMRKLLRDLAKGGMLTFEDIAAATALYRPGPMDSGMMDDYVQIRQGNRSPHYEHPSMEPVLARTHSIVVYQEQVMQLAVALAGFTGAESDHLRKAMGKKDKDKMAEMRAKWIDGCEKTSGMLPAASGDLFDKIEAFAGYGFNRSHSVEYSIISVWTMWVRVRYPAEYFAASLSIVGEEKLAGLVRDARECGIEVMPPDINYSSDKFTISPDGHLLAPFSSVKGCSENTALKIVKLREAHGPFKSDEEFKEAAATKGSGVNVRVVGSLEAVGAFANITPGALPARHFDRRRDQMALMPGLIIDAVKADRQTDVADKFIRAKIIETVKEYRTCDGCDLAGQPHPAVRMKSTVKFMVVFDSPSRDEEKKDRLLEGDGADFVKYAIVKAGLAAGDGYYTTLVKAKKNDKFLTNAQINGCSRFLDRELEVIKPAVIVALGSASIRRFLPGLKGGAAEHAGKAFFDPKLDATIVCGMNPVSLIFDDSKLPVLEGVFEKVAEILS